jgi:hypothetical protein
VNNQIEFVHKSELVEIAKSQMAKLKKQTSLRLAVKQA